MDPSGNIVVAGQLVLFQGTLYATTQGTVARYTPGGVLDSGFGGGIMVTAGFGADGGVVDVAVQRDGRDRRCRLGL